MSCILRHQGVQLILAYSWAWPAILAAGKGRGGMLFLLFHFPLSPLSLSFMSSTISSISLPSFSGRQHKVDMSLNPNTIDSVILKNLNVQCGN